MALTFLVFLPMLLAPLSWLIGRRSRRARDMFVIAAGFAELALALLAAFRGGRADFAMLCDRGLALETDGFRKVYCVVLAFMWAMTLLFSPDYFAHHHHRNRYYFFQLLTLGATMGVFLAADLFTAFVFFEIMSFTSFTWVIQEETPGAIRAAKTYLAVAVIGGLVALMGLFLLWRELGTLTVSALAPAAERLGKKPVLYAAGGCVLFGFGAKAGMFPVHIWLPKAHPVAPAPASALLSGALTKSGVWGILAISCNLFRGDAAWGAALLALACVTMFLGALLALFSVDLKRTLACSSMSQIGFILTGVAMGCLLGEENALAARGAVLHMVNHSAFKLVLFLCAGAVYRNLHALDLNEIRGFGRKKPLLMICFLLGALGIGGIPLLNGYISKTLLHESIVEGAAEFGGILKAVEWIFLLSGGLTLAYMTKLFVAIFVEKHPDRQAEFDAKKDWISAPAAAALALSALVIPVLGLTADRSMNAIADLAGDFLHAGHLHHAVHYLSWENLKGAGISVALGAAVYLGVVRTRMRRNGTYVNLWPAKLDLEDLVYRPLLLKALPGIFGALASVFGENRLTRRLAGGIFALGKKLAALFGENRLTAPAARGVFRLGGSVGEVFGENRVTEPAARGIFRLGGSVGETFGENRLTEPASRGIFAFCKTAFHAASDSLDALVLGLQRTVFRQSPERPENKVGSSVSYRLGEKLDRAAALTGRELPGDDRCARGLYRAARSYKKTRARITGNLSFALLLLVLAICAVFAYISFT